MYARSYYEAIVNTRGTPSTVTQQAICLSINPPKNIWNLSISGSSKKQQFASGSKFIEIISSKKKLFPHGSYHLAFSCDLSRKLKMLL